MKTSEEIYVKKQADIKFIIAAVSAQLNDMAYTEYFRTWESMGGMQWFFDECVSITEEIMLGKGSQYTSYLSYWSNACSKSSETFSEFTGKTCFDWYHMDKARELFESRYTKDPKEDILLQMGDNVASVLLRLDTPKERDLVLSRAESEIKKRDYAIMRKTLIKECGGDRVKLVNALIDVHYDEVVCGQIMYYTNEELIEKIIECTRNYKGLNN